MEKQLLSACQEISRLRTGRPNSPGDTQRTLAETPPLHDHGLGSSKRRKLTPTAHNFSAVRRNIRAYGGGVVDSPRSRISARNPEAIASVPELPLREVADHLLHEYQSSFQVCLPVLHWSSFTQRYEEVYRQGTLQNTPSDWIAVFFAVLSCASLRTNQGEGKKYHEIVKTLVDFWADDLTTEHVRCVFLTSIYLNEINSRSAGWTTMGYAIRIAQDIGLHREMSYAAPFEQELRSRLWWCIYVSDKYVPFGCL